MKKKAAAKAAKKAVASKKPPTKPTVSKKAPAKPKVAALRALVAALDSGDAEKVAVALANAKAVLK